MNILLVSRTSDDEKFVGRNKEVSSFGLSEDQPQSSWARAFQNNGHHVWVVTDRYSPVKTPGSNIVLRIFFAGLRRIIGKLKQFALSCRLHSVINGLNPDMIIISGGTNLHWRWAAKHKRHFLIVFFYGPSPWRGTVPSNDIKTARHAHYLVTNSEVVANEWQKVAGTEAFALPVSSCDLSVQQPALTSEPKYYYDVSFVGSLAEGDYQRRLEILRQLRDFDLAIWTNASPDILEKYDLTPFYKGKVSRTECPEVYLHSRICLNIHAASMADGGNLSTFEIPASRGFQIIDAMWDSWFVENEEVVMFKDIQDLREKIQYYLDNPAEREAIRDKGHKKVIENHTYEQRFQKLLSMLGSVEAIK